MGGSLIVLAYISTLALWVDWNNAYVWIATWVFMGCGALGACDDLLKVTRANPKGLSESRKLVGQLCVASSAMAMFMILTGCEYSLYFPFFKKAVLTIGPVLFALWGTGIIIGASNAVWQVLGQQVLMARMEFPLTALQALNAPSSDPVAVAAGVQSITDYIVAKNTPPASRTPAQVGLMNTAVNPKLGYNLDAWDGYPVAREILLAQVLAANKKLVTLAGDTHNAWHSDLTLKGLLPGSQADVKVGEEFAAPAVTSNGLEYYFPTLQPSQIKQIFEGVVDDLNWMDSSRRGYLKMSFTQTAATGEWVFINSVRNTSYTVDAPTANETRTYRLSPAPV